MSNANFYTATANTSNLLSLRTNVDEGFSKSRLYTPLVTAGSLTLSMAYDLILVDATASVTLSLPASPTTGDGYRIVKYDTTAGTLSVSGSPINVSLTSLSTITRWQGWDLRYSGDATIGWFACNLTGAS